MRKSIFGLLLFGALLYGLIQLYPRTDMIVPPLDILEIDSTALQQIDIRLPEGEELTLTRGARHWRLSNGRQTTNAVPEKVAALLDFLQTIKIDSFLAIDERRLQDLGLSPSKAIRWRLVDASGEEQTFQLGQGTFAPESKQSFLFVRLPKSGNVCSIYGKETLPVHLSFQALRSKVFSRFDPAQIRSLNWRHRADTLLQLPLSSDSPAALAEQDSLIGILLKTWAGLSGDQFHDQFNPVAASAALNDQLELTFMDDRPALRFDCFWDSSWVQPFVLHSSQQPDIFFRSDSTGGLYEALFRSLWDHRQGSQNPGAAEE